MYEDGFKDLLKGCPSCGGKFFFFIRKEKFEEAKEVLNKIPIEDKKKIEKDIYSLVKEKIDTEKPIVLDLATINIISPGKFEIDLVKLLKGEPLIYKLEEGKYIIDLMTTFKNLDTKKKTI